MKTLNSIAGFCLLLYVIYSIVVGLGGYAYRSLFESDAKAYARCAIASQHLGERKSSVIISNKLYKENVRPDQIIKWSSNYQASLDGKSGMATIYKLIKTYNSSSCLNAHEQGKIENLPFMYYVLYIFV